MLGRDHAGTRAARLEGRAAGLRESNGEAGGRGPSARGADGVLEPAAPPLSRDGLCVSSTGPQPRASVAPQWQTGVGPHAAAASGLRTGMQGRSRRGLPRGGRSGGRARIRAARPSKRRGRALRLRAWHAPRRPRVRAGSPGGRAHTHTRAGRRGPGRCVQALGALEPGPGLASQYPGVPHDASARWRRPEGRCSRKKGTVTTHRA